MDIKLRQRGVFGQRDSLSFRDMASAPAIHIGKRAYPLFIVTLLVALAACSGSSGSGSAASGTVMNATIPGPSGSLESSTITVEAVPTADEAGLYIASDLGYFQKEGLTVKIVPTGGGELAIGDLNNGTAKIVAGNYVSFIQAQIAGTSNLRILANGSQMQPGNQALYVLPNSKFRTVADLVKYHATIGVNTQKNIGTLLVGSLLADNGYSINDVKLFAPNPSAGNPFVSLLTMLGNNKIDAVWLPEPFGTIAQQKGAVQLADFDAGSLQNFPIGAYVASMSWIKSNPNTIAAFLHALQEGQQVADTDRAQVESSLIKHTLLTNNFTLPQSQQIASLITLDTYPLTMDVPTIQRVADSMFQFGVDGKTISKAYDMGNMIQPEPGLIH
jgi:NitT/TauT family transport system substrate-binding protein